jgi:ribose transport system ATP-binding protein
MTDEAPAAPLLEMRGIFKSFPGVQALRGVDLRLDAGEVLALLGENGAGKSTLMKILGGAQSADAGTLSLNDQPVSLRSPQDASRAGIAVIYQEFNLVPELTAVENIFLGRERSRAGFLRHAEERRLARALFHRLGAEFDPDVPCRQLTTAQQQIVEIAKALAFEARLLVMDEPTAALTAHEVERLFTVIRDLRQQGLGIIYISHRLDEIFAIADRVLVLRDGLPVGERPIADFSRSTMIEMMVGRQLKDEFPLRSPAIGETRLEVRGLCRGRAVRDVSFTVRRGEILGLAGLIGAGRTETARLVFGADRREAGEMWLDGRPLDIRSPQHAIDAGIGFLTEDRKHQGLVLTHPVRDNFALPNLDRLSHHGFVDRRREREEFAEYITRLHIRLPHQEQPAIHLPGGNQQKVVLAKWLARQCDVLIFDEPTRGIDAGAKYEIYQLLNDLAARGKAIIMISSELPELIGMADRILVMHDGRITGEISDARHTTQETIMNLAIA